MVSEVFGPTLQGEGPSIGRPCCFVRLGGCNLRCVWCDTPYTWNGEKYNLHEEIRPMSVEQILGKLGQLRCPGRVVISGGEPMLQQKQLVPLLEEIVRRKWRIEIETAGTIVPAAIPTYWDIQYNVSPKLFHSGNELQKRYHPGVLMTFNDRRAAFKFVCRFEKDLDEVDDIVKAVGIPPHRVFIMPEGTQPEEVLAHGIDLASPTIARGYNVTTRLHTLLWGNQRGR